MKKLKISSLSPSPLILIMAIATFVAVPMRAFQFTNCVEPATGFWLVKDFTVPTLYILSAVVVVLAFFMSAFSGIMPPSKFEIKKDIPTAIFALIFAVTFAVDCVGEVSKFLSIYDQFAADGTVTMIAYLIQAGGFSVALQILFGILSAIYMIIVGVSFFTGNEMYKKHTVIPLSLPVWAIARMAFHFIDPINYKNVSQLLFQLIVLVFIILFTLSFARIASDVNGESSMWILWFSGIAGAFFGYVSGLAPAILILIGKGDYMPLKYPVRYPDLGFALFVTFFLFTVMPRTIKKRTDS